MSTSPSNMKTIDLSDATLLQLDYLVGKFLGGTDFCYDGITWGFKLNGKIKVLSTGWAASMNFSPTKDWACGGPIFSEARVAAGPTKESLLKDGYDVWCATLECPYVGFGPTELIAKTRCYLIKHLGHRVEVPATLA